MSAKYLNACDLLELLEKNGTIPRDKLGFIPFDTVGNLSMLLYRLKIPYVIGPDSWPAFDVAVAIQELKRAIPRLDVRPHPRAVETKKKATKKS